MTGIKFYDIIYAHFGLKCDMFLPIPSLGAMESVLNKLQIKP